MPDQQTPPATPVSVRKPLGLPEFVVLTAMLMASNTLAIDIMLPALGEIGKEFQLANDNDQQLVVVAYMMGFGVSQLFYGPLTDRFGRRRVLFISLGCYVLAGIACVMAPSFKALIAARIFQGASAGGSRVIAISAARDLYSGRRMAKVMSLVLMIFMIAPIAAPALGQALMIFTNWKGIFWALTIFGLILFVWVYTRMPETLPEDRRSPLRPSVILGNYWTVIRTREALGYTIASGLTFSSLLSYIASSEQIYHDIYHTGAMFPFWFGGVAIAMSTANLLNSRIVERFGMRKISHTAQLAFLILAAIHAAIAAMGDVPFPVFYTLICGMFFTLGLQGPNYNAIGMEPLGRLAGSGAALIGFASSFCAASIGGFIARQFDGTLAPIFIGHFATASLCFLVILITERGKLFQTGEVSPHN